MRYKQQTGQTDTAGRFAWNGIAVSVPAGWEVGGLDSDSVRFDRFNGPACLLRWGRVNRFSPGGRVRSLRKAFAGKGFQLEGLPAWWERRLAGFASRGVQVQSWRWNEGVGGLLFFPDEAGRAGTVLMVQFPGLPVGDSRPEADQDGLEMAGAESGEADGGREVPLPGIEGNADTLMASLRVLTPDEPWEWAVYDVAFLTPPGFVQVSHDLRPGHYSFVFAGAGETLRFDRLGPADVILRNRVFPEWSGEFWRSLDSGLRLEEADLSADRVIWSGEEKARGFRALLGRGGRRVRMASWIPEGENRILAVSLRSHSPDFEMFSKICEEYRLVRTVQEKN